MQLPFDGRLVRTLRKHGWSRQRIHLHLPRASMAMCPGSQRRREHVRSAEMLGSIARCGIPTSPILLADHVERDADMRLRQVPGSLFVRQRLPVGPLQPEPGMPDRRALHRSLRARGQRRRTGFRCCELHEPADRPGILCEGHQCSRVPPGLGYGDCQQCGGWSASVQSRGHQWPVPSGRVFLGLRKSHHPSPYGHRWRDLRSTGHCHRRAQPGSPPLGHCESSTGPCVLWKWGASQFGRDVGRLDADGVLAKLDRCYFRRRRRRALSYFAARASTSASSSTGSCPASKAARVSRTRRSG